MVSSTPIEVDAAVKPGQPEAQPAASEPARLATDSARTFLYRIAIFTLTLLNGIVIARALTPAEKGAYNLAVALPRLLLRFGNLGVGDAAIYQIGKRTHSFRYITANVFSLALVVGALLTGLAILLYQPLSQSFLKGVEPVFFLVAICTIPPALLTDFAQDLLRGVRDIRAYNRSRTGHYVFLLIGTSILLLALSLRLPGAMLAFVLMTVGDIALVLVMLRRHTPLGLDADRDLVGDMSHFGLRAYVMQLVMYLNYDLDIFIVNFFAKDTASVGFYSLAAGLAETLWYLPNAVTVVLFPTIAANLKRGGELTPKASRHVLFLTLLSAVALALVLPLLLPFLYGARYAPAIEPLLLLLPGVVTLSVFKVVSTGLFGRGQPMLASWAAIIGLTLQIALDIVLIPAHGINGAAIASTLAYSLMSVLGVMVYVRQTGIPPRDLLILKREDWQVYGRLIRLPLKRLRRLSGSPRWAGRKQRGRSGS